MKLTLNQTELILYYERIGSSWLVDGIYTFLVAPFGLIGIILNLFSLFIFYSIKLKRSKLYIYLRFYTINGSILCFLSSLWFISMSPLYSPFYLSYLWRFFRAYVFTMVFTIIYLISILLDLIIAFDRLAIFYTGLKKFYIKLKPHLIIISFISVSFIINLPTCFSYYVKSEQEFVNDVKYNLTIFSFNGRTSYFYSQHGLIIAYVQLFIRDILTLIVEIIISSISYYSFRKFNINRIDMDLILNQRHDSSITNRNNENMRKKLIKDRQLLLMNLILSLLSIVSHLFIFITYVLVYRGVSIELFVLVSLAIFGISFKHFLNFFIFYFFNSNFKTKCNELFKNTLL